MIWSCVDRRLPWTLTLGAISRWTSRRCAAPHPGSSSRRHQRGLVALRLDVNISARPRRIRVPVQSRMGAVAVQPGLSRNQWGLSAISEWVFVSPRCRAATASVDTDRGANAEQGPRRANVSCCRVRTTWTMPGLALELASPRVWDRRRTSRTAPGGYRWLGTHPVPPGSMVVAGCRLMKSLFCRA